MYKNRKFNKNTSTKRTLNTIDENASTKLSRTTNSSHVPTTSEASNKFDQQGSEENIPASQELTQRFLSQRSVLASTLGRTQSRTNCSRPPNTYFEMILMKAGVQLDDGDTFVLACDHVAFVTKFRDNLMRAQNYPDNIESFKTGLQTALAAKSKLATKLLTGCTISAPGEEHVYQTQDSMFVNFLMIDFLRDAALEVLLERIKEEAVREQTILSNGYTTLLPLMLTQLRYVTMTHSEQIFTCIQSIFAVASDAAKADIIISAEFVLNASKHDAFVELLIENYAQSKELFSKATMQTLICLSLSAKMHEKLSARILAFIKDEQCPRTILPLLIKFILKVINEDTNTLRELVKTLREIFNYIAKGANINGATTSKESELELFKFLEQSLTRSKRFYICFQKTIVNLPAQQFQSFDFIILLLLLHVREENGLYIENIFRRRIKLEHFTVDILDEIKAQYPHILQQHVDSLIQILHKFMREKHKIVADFAKTAYSKLFKICDAIQKMIIQKLLKLTCDKSAQIMINTALQLLRELQRNYRQDVQNCSILLMPLLDRLHDMTLPQTQVVMELLCSIAYPPPTLTDCPTLQNQIDMLVKKQLINRTPIVKKQGIISSVQLIDNIARIETYQADDHDKFNATFNTINDLPVGRGKTAANCVLRTQSATLHCAESLALFYDELASACTTPTQADYLVWDTPFLIWLCELTTYYFQNSFVVQCQPELINGIQLAYNKCINSIEDTTTNTETEVLSIAINIGELVLKPKPEANSSVLVLAPLFNLLRMLQLQRYEGSLETINALLGCAIILPDFFDSATADSIYYDYGLEQQQQILDIYFHTVNWMRVIVCAFAALPEPATREKVMTRLSDMIQIEKKIKLLLMRAPADYVPPQCQFLNDNAQSVAKSSRAKPVGTAAKTNRAKAKQQQTETQNSTINEINLSEQTRLGNNTNVKLGLAGAKTTAKQVKIDFDQLYGPRECYRQLEWDIMLILHEKFSLEYPLPAADVGQCFGLAELRFILHDLVHKLESIVEQQCENDSNLQHIAKPYKFMHNLYKTLPYICSNMRTISTAIVTQLEQNKFTYSNSELFTEQFNYKKVCFGLSVRLLAAYFSWNEFTSAERDKLLKKSLLAIMPRQSMEKMRELQSQNSSQIAAAAFDTFYGYEQTVANLSTAVQLLHLLRTLRKFTMSDAQLVKQAELQGHNLRKLCRTFLCRKWYNYTGSAEKGSQCNIYLDELVKAYLKDSQFTRQKDILFILSEECKNLNAKDGVLTSFPNINKANFPLLFRGFCELLITTLNNKLADNAERSDQLKIWEQSGNILNMLLDIIRTVEQPRNFLLFLKHAHHYIKLLLQHGLQILETHLRQNVERVSSFIKQLQHVTRFLHNLCCHSKAIKQFAIVNQIPMLRETVENLVFRIKALLAANKCHSVFWMGNLVNKDIHGDTILMESGSFGKVNSNDDGNNSEEELPEDDATWEDTLLDIDNEMPTDRGEQYENRHKSRSTSLARSECF